MPKLDGKVALFLSYLQKRISKTDWCRNA